MADVSIFGGLAKDTSVAAVTTAVNATSSTPQSIFRDAMDSLKPANWDVSVKAASDLLYAGGSTASAGWVSICKSALVADTYTEMVSKQSWPLAVAAAAALTISQRIQGQEFAFDLIGVDSNGVPITTAQPADVPLTGGGVATGATVTFTSVGPHGMLPGDVIAIYGAADSRLNFGPVTVQQTPSATTFQVNSGLGATTYTVGANAYVRFIPPDGFATYIASHRFWGTSGNNADIVSKNGERMPETQTWNPLNNFTDAQIPNENGINYSNMAYSAPQRARYEFNIRLHPKYSNYFAKAINSTGQSSSVVHRSENTPDASRQYKIRFRGRNLPNHVIPVGYITAAAKSGTTTTTLTVPNHGLTTSDFVNVYGIRDQTNFVNTTNIQVQSVPDANTVTVLIPTPATATSYGGFVMRNQAIVTPAAVASSAVQTYYKTADGQRIGLTFGASAATPVIGEVWTLYGLVTSTNAAQTALHGRYRVDQYITTSPFTVELTPLDGQDISGVSTTAANAGGSIIRNTEFRIHFVRVESEQNSIVEVVGGQGDTDFALAVPVSLQNGTINLSQIAGSSPSTIITQSSTRGLTVMPPAAILNTDRTSAASTTSGNTGTIADDFGAALSAFISVSTVTGTTPRMDLTLQESYDNGGTWQDIYMLPRVTAATTLLVPYVLIAGRRRWAWTIGGTTPSFSFTISVNRGAIAPTGFQRNFFDYTSASGGVINVNTLNSSTNSWYAEGCQTLVLNVSMAAGGTTAPVFQLQNSPDNATWFNVGPPITATASLNQSQAYDAIPLRHVRVLTSTAGVGAVGNFINLTGK